MYDSTRAPWFCACATTTSATVPNAQTTQMSFRIVTFLFWLNISICCSASGGGLLRRWVPSSNHSSFFAATIAALAAGFAIERLFHTLLLSARSAQPM